MSGKIIEAKVVDSSSPDVLYSTWYAVIEGNRVFLGTTERNEAFRFHDDLVRRARPVIMRKAEEEEAVEGVKILVSVI